MATLLKVSLSLTSLANALTKEAPISPAVLFPVEDVKALEAKPDRDRS